MLTKNLLITFWLGSIIAFFLWYRNQKYDRSISPFLFLLSLSNLVLYGYKSGADPSQVCKFLIFLAALQFFAFSLGIFFMSEGNTMIQNLSRYLCIISFALLIFSIFYLLHCDANILNDNELEINSLSVSKYLAIFYFVFLMLGLGLLNCQYQWKNLALTLSLIVSLGLILYYNNDFFYFFPNFTIFLGLMTWFSTIERRQYESK